MQTPCLQRARLLGAAFLLIVSAALAAGWRRPEPPRVSVLTWNIDNGVPPYNGIPDMFAVSQSVAATRFSERVESIAQIIDEHRPQLVCLQEVAYWRGWVRLDPIDDNFRVMLQQSLLDRGLQYNVVGSLPVVNFYAQFDNDSMFPSTLRWRESIVILARHSSQLEVLNVWAKSFDAFFASGGVDFKRGWVAADIKVQGRRARYVCTQLEPRSSSVRQAQAAQLIDWLSGTNQPVLVMGDMSSEPSSAVYTQFTNAGYSDAWLANHDLLDGPTCCQVPALTNATTQLDRRTDFTFVRGAATPISANRVGNRHSDRTGPPINLWPSDHAGVVAKVQLE